MTHNPEYIQAVREFFSDTQILEYGEITGQVKDIIHPGESNSVGHNNLVTCLGSLIEEDKALLLKTVIMNDIFDARELSPYDWGYWIDKDDNRHVIPYSVSRSRSQLCKYIDYQIYGQLPTIELLMTNYHDFLLTEVTDDIAKKIETWQLLLHTKLATNCAGFLELDRNLQKGLQSLREAY